MIALPLPPPTRHSRLLPSFRDRLSCPARPRLSARRTGIHRKRAGRSHGYGITVPTIGGLTHRVNTKRQNRPPGKPGRRRRLQPTLAALSGILLLIGCGSGNTPNHIAAADGAHITNAEVQQNIECPALFSLVDPGSITTQAGMCLGTKVSAGCLRLRRQVISRLVEQHVIQAYARQRITLGPSDHARVDKQVARLVAAGAETSSSSAATLSVRGLCVRCCLPNY
jgi:hypothetical protein